MTNFDQQLLSASKAKNACPILPVSQVDLVARLKELSPPQRRWAKLNNFRATAGEVLVFTKDDGRPEQVLLGIGQDNFDPFQAGALPDKLPEGRYRFDNAFDHHETMVLAFLLGCYQFDKYKTANPRGVALVCPKQVDRAETLRIAGAVKLARDLINTPANDMGPQELQDAAFALARQYKARSKAIKGKALQTGFPMVHAVGRGSSRPPRMIDFTWGNARHAKVTLVGKGVVFDTGGLDLKPSSGMILMKKDMGGAANVLGLAQMIMDADLPVRLRVLIPAVENAVGSDAFRPSDILKSRKGITVEIGNTDAEGRLVLADALALADEQKPELLIDMATLTGAARVALGPDLPPFYVDDDAIANEIESCGTAVGDPLWRMPFWRPYETVLSSKVADTNNIGGGGFGGSITAALFLNKFVEKARHHIHFDIYGWTPTAKPGKPVGGEAQGIRALYAFLQQRYGR
ncbi:MAG TPA: leucyl aminopeptidase family protein [Rhizobiales bacterium]|nr:leucyl aminopeptidase family protein [Hyphomicrobiales bacterium]